MKKEGKSHAAISNYVSAIKSYYQINDVVLNVKKIGRFMPEQIRIRKDRAYIHEEISKTVNALSHTIICLIFTVQVNIMYK
jgi:hypothetical protein